MKVSFAQPVLNRARQGLLELCSAINLRAGGFNNQFTIAQPALAYGQARLGAGEGAVIFAGNKINIASEKMSGYSGVEFRI